MYELVFAENGRPVTDSLMVSKVFEKDHDKVVRDIRKIIGDVDMEWGVANFGETPYEHPQNKQTYQKYIMTEDGFTILVMGYTGKKAMEFKVKYIKEFRKMQEELNQQKPILPQAYREALVALLEKVEENERLEQENKMMLPKVQTYDRFIDRDESLRNVGVVAKELGDHWGEKRLYHFLREVGILFKQGGNNVPKQEYMKYFVVKETVKNNINCAVPLVNPKGQEFIMRHVEEFEEWLDGRVITMKVIEEYAKLKVA